MISKSVLEAFDFWCWEHLGRPLGESGSQLVSKMVPRPKTSKFWPSLGGNHGDQNRWKSILKKYFKCFYEFFLKPFRTSKRTSWTNMSPTWGQLESTWEQIEANLRQLESNLRQFKRSIMKSNKKNNPQKVMQDGPVNLGKLRQLILYTVYFILALVLFSLWGAWELIPYSPENVSHNRVNVIIILFIVFILWLQYPEVCSLDLRSISKKKKHILRVVFKKGSTFWLLFSKPTPRKLIKFHSYCGSSQLGSAH